MNSTFLKLKNLANSIIGTRTGTESKEEYLSSNTAEKRNSGGDNTVLAQNNGELYEQLLKQFPEKASPRVHDEKQLHKLSAFTIF